MTVRRYPAPTFRHRDESTHHFEFGDLQARISAGPLLGFWRQVGDLIVVGESCFPLNETDVRRLEEGILNRVPIDRLLGDHILILVVVSLREQVATIAHSIASWRPCYVATGTNVFTVSTSVSGLREVGHEIAWDPTCTPEYLTYRFISAPRSIVRGIRRVAGGQLLIVDLATGGIREDRRWRWPEPDGSGHAGDILELLRSRVEEWLRFFPRAGILLSGGLDSSLLTALARLARPDVPTFSANFSFVNSGDGEAQYARSMARHLRVPHEVHQITAERYLTGWVESVHAAEQPVQHIQSVLLHVLFQDRTSVGHGAILSGEGADGLFGNNRHMFLSRHRHKIACLRAARLDSLLAPLAHRLGWQGRLGSLLTRRYDGQFSSDRHFLWLGGRYGDPSIVQRLLVCDSKSLLGERPGYLEAYCDRPMLDHVTALALLFAGTTMAIWGKLAEASGIRLACPYTTPSVLAAVMAVPWDVKLREEKHLVRASLRRLDVPESLVTRPKLSFGLPAQFWAPKGALFQPVVDMAKLVNDASVLESLQTEEGGAAMVLWCLLNQFLWTQLFEARRSVGDVAGEILDRHRAAVRVR